MYFWHSILLEGERKAWEKGKLQWQHITSVHRPIQPLLPSVFQKAFLTSSLETSIFGRSTCICSRMPSMLASMTSHCFRCLEVWIGDLLKTATVLECFLRSWIKLAHSCALYCRKWLTAISPVNRSCCKNIIIQKLPSLLGIWSYCTAMSMHHRLV